MRKFQCAVTFLICSSFALLAIAAEELDWREARQEDEITISVSDVTGSKHQAVRAEMTIQATLNAPVGPVSYPHLTLPTKTTVTVILAD